MIPAIILCLGMIIFPEDPCYLLDCESNVSFRFVPVRSLKIFTFSKDEVLHVLADLLKVPLGTRSFMRHKGNA